jgi:signal transduction histidine kinase
MGLGLTIARKIALDHGGDLTLLEDNDRDGATFLLDLPIR